MKKFIKSIAFCLITVISASVATFFMGCAPKDEEDGKPSFPDSPTPDITGVTTVSEYKDAAYHSAGELFNIFGSIFNFDEENYLEEELTFNTLIKDYAEQTSYDYGIQNNIFLYQDRGDNLAYIPTYITLPTRYEYSKYMRLASMFLYSFSNTEDLNLNYVRDIISYGGPSDMANKKAIDFNAIYYETYKNSNSSFIGSGIGANVYDNAGFYIKATYEGNKIYFNVVETTSYGTKTVTKDAVQITIDYNFGLKQVNSIDVQVFTVIRKFLRQNIFHTGNGGGIDYGIESLYFDLKNNYFDFSSYGLQSSMTEDQDLEKTIAESQIREDYTNLRNEVVFLNSVLDKMNNSKIRAIYFSGSFEKSNNYYDFRIDQDSWYNADPYTFMKLQEGAHSIEETKFHRERLNKLLRTPSYATMDRLFITDRAKLSATRVQSTLVLGSTWYHGKLVDNSQVLVSPPPVDNRPFYKGVVNEVLSNRFIELVAGAMYNESNDYGVTIETSLVDGLHGYPFMNKHQRYLSIMRYLFSEPEHLNAQATSYISTKYGVDGVTIDDKESIKLDTLYKETVSASNFYQVGEYNPYIDKEYYYIARLSNTDISLTVIEDGDDPVYINMTVKYNFRTNTIISVSYEILTQETIGEQTNTLVENWVLYIDDMSSSSLTSRVDFQRLAMSGSIESVVPILINKNNYIHFIYEKAAEYNGSVPYFYRFKAEPSVTYYPEDQEWMLDSFNPYSSEAFVLPLSEILPALNSTMDEEELSYALDILTPTGNPTWARGLNLNNAVTNEYGLISKALYYHEGVVFDHDDIPAP